MSARSTFRLLWFMSAAFLALALFLVAVERVNACACRHSGGELAREDCPFHGVITP